MKEQVVPLVFLAMHDRPSGESGEWQLSTGSSEGGSNVLGVE